jgi:hypothetical protein
MSHWSSIFFIRIMPPHGGMSLSVNPISKSITPPVSKSYSDFYASLIYILLYFCYAFLLKILSLRNRNLILIAESGTISFTVWIILHALLLPRAGS